MGYVAVSKTSGEILIKKLSYDDMMELAKNCGEYKYFDVNDSALVAPKNMIEAIGKLIGSDDLGLFLILLIIPLRNRMTKR